MTAQPIKRASPSLLERAAQAYDFDAAFRPGSKAPSPDGAPPEITAPLISTPVLSTPVISTPAPDQTTPPTPPRPRVHQHRRVAIDRGRLASEGLLVPGAAIGVLAEEFRLVKRQLLLTAKTLGERSAPRGRTILVSSANPEEGKTFCALNLAISMAAEREVDVLLVDADFAKADVMPRLGIADGPGLLDALADPAIDVEALVLATDIPQLSVLPAGTKTIQDTELLASERTPALLNALLDADPRRIIILDSPPALAASTAATLALHVGQIMMVVRADRTSSNDLREAVALLGGCDHIQLLLNAASFAAAGRRFGSYYPHEALS